MPSIKAGKDLSLKKIKEMMVVSPARIITLRPVLLIFEDEEISIRDRKKGSNCCLNYVRIM
jgi:hypothetical protein